MDESSSPPNPPLARPTESKASFFSNYSVSWWIPVAIVIALVRLKGAVACGSGVEAAKALAPLSESEAIAFGAKLESALEECTPASIGKVFDIDHLLRETVRRSDIPKRAQEEVLAQMQGRVTPKDIEFCDPEDWYDHARFIRLRERDGQQVLLVRVWGAEDFDYLEFFAGKRADGQIVATDAYVYGAGSSLRDAFTEMMDALVASDISTSEAEDVRSAIAEIDSNPEYALEVIEQLPERLRNTKAVQLHALNAAATMDLDIYINHLEGYKKIFPHDPSVTFLSFAVYTSNFETKLALETLDAIDDMVGGDTYLDVERAEVLIAAEDYPAALIAAQGAVDAEPDDVMSYYILFQALVWNRDFVGAVEVLRTLDEKFDDGYSEEEMWDMGDAFLEFIESSQWRDFSGADQELPVVP